MKRIIFCLCVAVFLVSGHAACGGDSAQTDEFVSACVESDGEATEERCRCAAKELQEKLTSEQFQVVIDTFALASAAENDPEKAMELMAKLAEMGEDVMTALNEAGRSCE